MLDVFGKVGICREILGETGVLAAPVSNQERLEEFFERIATDMAGFLFHGEKFSLPPESVAKISLSLRRARMYRLLAADS